VLFAPMGRAAAYTAHTLAGYGLLAAVVWFFLAVPQAKSVLDQIKLFLPVIGQVERELAVNRFFHSFNMLYSTGGMRVEAMIELAARAVTNVAVRDDLLRAARAIESGSTVAEAFAAPATLTEDQRTTIAAGEHAGKLDTAFATISRHTGESVQHRLKKFNEISFRIVTLAVTFSIAATLLSLITAIRPSG
jgi:type II secretory pathway component PulF